MSDAETVLIADDDADILELLHTVLERAGYGPIAATDGEEALGSPASDCRGPASWTS